MRGFSPALFAAGLLLFAAHLRADQPLSGRSVAPASLDQDQALSSEASTAAEPGIAADLDEQDGRLREQDRRLRDQDGRLQDQAIRLSGVAETLSEASAALAFNAKAQERLAAGLEGLRERIEGLERKSLALDEAQSVAAVSAAAGVAQQKQLAKDLEELKADVAENEGSLAAGLKSLQSTRAQLSRLDSMAELLGMVKRDEETNDEELVEVKQALQRLEPPPSSANAAWWDALVSWKYLPAVATGLGVVALGVAAFNH